MTPLVWLALAAAAGAAAYVVGWRTMRTYRSREQRDMNAERYMAWRGRAARPLTPGGSMREGMTGEERRAIALGGVLGLVAVAALVAFFATS